MKTFEGQECFPSPPTATSQRLREGKNNKQGKETLSNILRKAIPYPESRTTIKSHHVPAPWEIQTPCSLRSQKWTLQLRNKTLVFTIWMKKWSCSKCRILPTKKGRLTQFWKPSTVRGKSADKPWHKALYCKHKEISWQQGASYSNKPFLIRKRSSERLITTHSESREY